MRRWLTAGILALPVAFLFFSWATLMDDIPSFDDFDALLGYLSHPFPSRLVEAFAKHNEHRIALTRLVAEAIVAIRGSFSFTAMAFVGNLLLVAFAGLWYRVLAPKSRWLAVGAFALLLSLAHRENQLWAMTSIQNVAVMLFAFGAILLAVRESSRAFAAAICCAVLATLSSGGGVFVWPCLLLQEFFGARRKGRLALVAVVGLVLFAALAAVPSPAAETIVVQDAPKPGETVIAKTNILRFQVELTPMFILRHIGYAACFFVSLLGGAAVFPLATFALGIVVLLSFVLLWKGRETVRRETVVWFLLFLLMNLAPCAVFRSVSFTTEVPSRYLVVCIPVALSVLSLLNQRRLLTVAGIAFLALALLSDVVYYPRMAVRRANLAENFDHWREVPEALHYPADRIDRATDALRRCEAAGIYSRSVQMPSVDESRARYIPKPVDW